MFESSAMSTPIWEAARVPLPSLRVFADLASIAHSLAISQRNDTSRCSMTQSNQVVAHFVHKAKSHSLPVWMNRQERHSVARARLESQCPRQQGGDYFAYTSWPFGGQLLDRSHHIIVNI